MRFGRSVISVGLGTSDFASGVNEVIFCTTSQREEYQTQCTVNIYSLHQLIHGIVIFETNCKGLGKQGSSDELFPLSQNRFGLDSEVVEASWPVPDTDEPYG